MYQNENPKITISSETRTIVSVKITYTVSNTGILTLNGSNVESNTVVPLPSAFTAHTPGVRVAVVSTL
jgi:hypothetical protein